MPGWFDVVFGVCDNRTFPKFVVVLIRVMCWKKDMRRFVDTIFTELNTFQAWMCR